MKKLSKQEREKWIETINKLINYYSKWDLGSIPDSYQSGERDCPFCVICSDLLDSNPDSSAKFCTPCPWVLFKGHSCLAKDSNGLTYSCYPVKDRLARLNLWKKYLVEGNII